MQKLKERFRAFSLEEKISLVLAFLMMLVGFYFAISMNVKIASGLTLFGNANRFKDGVIESKGPSYSDYLIMSMIYILSILLLGYLVFVVFFKKIEKKKVIRKEIVNGKTVILEDVDKNEVKQNGRNQ